MRISQRFADRRAAGRTLVSRLTRYIGRRDLVVLALPRGGVPVAYEVALALRAPLDVLVVRKLGVPGRRELAFGAIASGGVSVLNRDVAGAYGLTGEMLEAVLRRELRELQRRERSYRGLAAPLEVSGRTALVVDDGMATGATMRAAITALRARNATAVDVAVPAASPVICSEIAALADSIVCACTPEPFVAVGGCYSDFEPTTDREVRELLKAVSLRRDDGGGASASR